LKYVTSDDGMKTGSMSTTDLNKSDRLAATNIVTIAPKE